MNDKVAYWIEMSDYDFDTAKAMLETKRYLYGSYSKGNPTEDSDIDIAVIVERMSDNYFEDTPLLWKLKRKISNLIEPVLLTEDINNPLYADILKTGMLI